MYKKIASNTIAQILSKFLTACISIFLIGVLTKYLPIEMYGNYNKVYNYLGIFAFLADLGLYAIMIREISLKRVSAEKIIGNVLTLRTGLGICIIFLALLIATITPGLQDPFVLIAIFLVGIFTLISLINSALLALMQSQLKMEFSLFSVVLGKIINISCVILFLIFIFSGEGRENIAFISVFIAGIFGIIVNTGLNYCYASKIVKIKYLYDREYIKEIFFKALPYGAALFLSVVYFKIDIFLIPFFETGEQADVSIALYALPMKIIEVLMVLGGFYLNSLLPSLTEKYEKHDTIALKETLGISLKILLSFGLLIFILGNLFATETISIIATPEYITPFLSQYNSVQAFSLVLGVLVFHFIALGCMYMLIASGKQKTILFINSGVVLVNIIGNIVFIPLYSFMGAAYVTLFSQALLMLVCMVLVLKNMSLSLKYYASYFYSCIVAGILFFIFSEVMTRSFSDMLTILIFAPIITGIYICLEYFAVKRLITRESSGEHIKY